MKKIDFSKPLVIAGDHSINGIKYMGEYEGNHYVAFKLMGKRKSTYHCFVVDDMGIEQGQTTPSILNKEEKIWYTCIMQDRSTFQKFPVARNNKNELIDWINDSGYVLISDIVEVGVI